MFWGERVCVMPRAVSFVCSFVLPPVLPPSLSLSLPPPILSIYVPSKRVCVYWSDFTSSRIFVMLMIIFHAFPHPSHLLSFSPSFHTTCFTFLCAHSWFHSRVSVMTHFPPFLSLVFSCGSSLCLSCSISLFLVRVPFVCLCSHIFPDMRARFSSCSYDHFHTQNK